MKQDALLRFEELEKLIDRELTEISNTLINNLPTYFDVVNEITDKYESENKLDELLYSKVYQRMLMEKTGR